MKATRISYEIKDGDLMWCVWFNKTRSYQILVSCHKKTACGDQIGPTVEVYRAARFAPSQRFAIMLAKRIRKEFIEDHVLSDTEQPGAVEPDIEEVRELVSYWCEQFVIEKSSVAKSNYLRYKQQLRELENASK